MELVAGFCLICGLYLVIRFVCFVVRQLIMLPGRLLRRRASWRAVPLQTKNHCRSAFGAAALVALALYVVKHGGVHARSEFYWLGGLAAVALGVLMILALFGRDSFAFAFGARGLLHCLIKAILRNREISR